MNRSFVAVAVLAITLMPLFAPASEAITVTFNSNVELLLLNTGDSPDVPAPGDCADCPFDLVNNTGTTWTDFHFRLAQGTGIPGTFDFPDCGAPCGGFDGVAYEGPGTATLSGCCEFDVVGLDIPSGGTYSLTLDIDEFEIIGTVDLFGIPTTDALPPDGVPEPSTLVLLGSAMAAMWGVLRRRGRRGSDAQ